MSVIEVLSVVLNNVELSYFLREQSFLFLLDRLSSLCDQCLFRSKGKSKSPAEPCWMQVFILSWYSWHNFPLCVVYLRNTSWPMVFVCITSAIPVICYRVGFWQLSCWFNNEFNTLFEYLQDTEIEQTYFELLGVVHYMLDKCVVDIIAAHYQT